MVVVSLLLGIQLNAWSSLGDIFTIAIVAVRVSDSIDEWGNLVANGGGGTTKILVMQLLDYETNVMFTWNLITRALSLNVWPLRTSRRVMKIYQGTKFEEAHVVRRWWWRMMSYYVKDSSGPWAGAIRRDQRCTFIMMVS